MKKIQTSINYFKLKTILKEKTKIKPAQINKLCSEFLQFLI